MECGARNVPIAARWSFLFHAPRSEVRVPRKAGRYKLAAPVSKTGSVQTEVGALPTPSAKLVEGRASNVESRNVSQRKSCLRLLTSTFDPSRPVAQKQSTRLITGRRRSVTCRDDHFFKPSTKENPMKPVIRYQSQLPFRKSYKPDRLIRVRLAQRAVKGFRPVRIHVETRFTPSS